MEGQDRLSGRLLGTCLLERMIGTGGMGAVYLAKQIRPVREVAIKVLQSGMLVRSSEHQAFLARFRREANVIAQLDHINIMPIYEYGEQDEYAYLVMPYLTGGSLLERLSERSILEPEEALIYVEQVASALHYAHQRKIVHRDVKPANILFHSDGRLVLADFGIARIVRSEEEGDTALTSEQQIVGSVEYMAPEMVGGKDVDHRADIYELGVVLFQMLTGRLPYQGRSALEIAVKHIEELFPAATEFNPQLSAAIGVVVARATARRPEERYQSTPEMVQALREAIERDKKQGRSRSAYATTPGWEAQETRLTPSSASPGAAQIAATDYSNRPVQNSSESSAYPFSNQSRNVPVSQHNGTQPGVEQQSYHTDIAHIGRVTAKKRAQWPAWVIACLLLIGLGIGVYLKYPQLTGLLSGANPTQPAATQPAATSVAGGGTTASSTAVPTASSTPQASPTVDPSQQAESFLQQYYQYINQKDYHSAYSMLGAKLTKLQTYNQYVNGFAATQQDTLTITSVNKRDDGSYNLNVTLRAEQQDNSSKTFTGNYVVDINSISGKQQIIDSHLQ